MNVINDCCSKVQSGFLRAFEVATFTVNHAEPLEKVAKLLDRIIRVAELIFNGLSTAWSTFNGQIRDTIIVFESLRFIGVMNMLVSPTKDGKSFFAANSWQKSVDRVTLAFHTAFKTVKGLNKFGLVDIGFLAKQVIGKLPLFTLLMDSFIIASSFFSTWDSVANGLPRAGDDINLANGKIDKWEYRPTAVALLKVNDALEIEHFSDHYVEKIVKLDKKQTEFKEKIEVQENKKLKALAKDPTQADNSTKKIVEECNKEIQKHTLDLNKAISRIERKEHKLSLIASNNFKELAAELEKPEAGFKAKMRKWEIFKENAQQARTKVWVAIANAVGKIAVVTLALTMIAIDLWAFPFALTLLLLGIAVDSIGLTKLLLAEFWVPQPLPKAAAAT